MSLAAVALVSTASALRLSWPAPAGTVDLAGYDVLYYPTGQPLLAVRHGIMIPQRTAWIKGLTSANAYTVMVRTVDRAGVRVDHATGASTTGAPSVSSYDKTALLRNADRGVYDLDSLTGTGAVSRDAVAASIFSAGDVVSRRTVVGKVGKDVIARVVPVNATAAAPKRSGALYFPFDAAGAGTQTAQVVSSTGTQVSVTYATAAPAQLTVAGTVRPIKTAFILDGRRAYVARA